MVPEVTRTARRGCIFEGRTVRVIYGTRSGVVCWQWECIQNTRLHQNQQLDTIGIDSMWSEGMTGIDLDVI